MALLKPIIDLRAFAGAASLTLVGIHLSVMMAFYFIPGGEAFAILQARWWWEVAFNLQVICFFFMYVCHSRRMSAANGWRKLRARWRFFVGALGVSVPTWVLVIAAQNNWFRSPPQQEDLIYYGTITFSLWVIGAYLIPLVYYLVSGKGMLIFLWLRRLGWKFILLYVSPFLWLFFLYLFEKLHGGHSHIIMWPFLTYLHSALYYYRVAFAFRPLKYKNI